MPEWGAQSFQAAWFQDQSVDLGHFFEKIVGAKPDAATQHSVGVSVAVGNDGKTQYRCHMQPGRLDYFEALVPGSGNAFPLFVPPEDNLPIFVDRAMKAEVGNVARLALVSNLFKPIPSGGNITEETKAALGLSFPFEGGSDLFLQINRPMAFPSKPDLQMNRLLKFQGQSFQSIQLDAGAPIITTAQFVTLEVDLNCPATPGLSFPPSDQALIWNDLKTEAMRLCAARTLAALA
jgi:hypothetical protein